MEATISDPPIHPSLSSTDTQEPTSTTNLPPLQTAVLQLDTCDVTMSRSSESSSDDGSRQGHGHHELHSVLSALKHSLSLKQQIQPVVMSPADSATDLRVCHADDIRRPSDGTLGDTSESDGRLSLETPSSGHGNDSSETEGTVVDEEVQPIPDQQSVSNPGKAQDKYEDEILDLRFNNANCVALRSVDLKDVEPNLLNPREQENADERILVAIHHLFNNQFTKAKCMFDRQAATDPLHALGLGSMAFLKAVMTMNNQTTQNAIEVLMSAYDVATAQINGATKRTMGDTVVRYFTNYYNSIKFNARRTGLPASPKPATHTSLEKHKITFIPNGVLRAHVAKAECCLQMAILNLLQENVVGYIKCGLNIKRAYSSYSVVWQEYKRMGQLYNDFIDHDTVSGIQFGIGTVHLVLASLPQKILRIVSSFGWKADKHLGFALLKLCLEERRIRSPMASLMLLAYYTILTSHCPQILAKEYTQPAIETLLDAQRSYPNSAFFLYFAGRTSRLARNLSLSTQSFMYAIEISKNEWAEVEVLHLCSYELGLNYMMQHNWEEAGVLFEQLYKEKYWSPAIFRYLHAACLEMVGLHTEAILAFAEIPELVGGKTNSSTAATEQYVLSKVKTFQASGYQDMDMSLCALEYLYILNAFDFMDDQLLQQSLALTEQALNRILEAEKMEYGIRTRELLPETPPPEYFDQRGALLLLKSSILNAMGRHQESIIHLNWVIDHKDKIETDKWIVPFVFWEAGITAWSLDNKSRGRAFWETALKYSKYDFEYRLAVRLNLALTRANELGISSYETTASPLQMRDSSVSQPNETEPSES